MNYEYYGLTNVGLKRSLNEDYYSVEKKLDLLVLADGMGGHNAGEVASKTAVEIITKFIKRCKEDKDFTWPFGFNPNLLDAENKILTGIRLANRELCNLSIEKKEFSGMGTTIVAGLIEDSKITIAHVGDSRIYRIRNNKIEQMTIDHSWVSEQIQKKLITEEEARNHRWKNVITRALGNKIDVEIDMKTIDIAPDDIYLFCTDGLSGMLEDADICDTALKNKHNLKAVSENLIEKANAAGGIDNITVILVHFFSTYIEDPEETQS